MARNRMINKETAEDVKIGKLSDSAKWLFIQLWILADDEGFLKNEPEWIKVKVWPYEINKDVNLFLQELFDLGLIETKNGIIKIKNFLNHQRIDKPQKSKLVDIFMSDSRKSRGQSAKGREESRLIEVNIKEIEVKEKLNKKEENIKENKISRIVFVKPTKTEIIDYINEKQLKVDSETFIDHYESNGWKVGKVPMKDWKATLRNWDRKTKEVKKPFKNEFLDILQKEKSQGATL